MPIFIVFLLIPLIEIGLFIKIGGLITLWPTLAIVVITAFLGAFIVKYQGLAALNEVKSSLNRFSDPTQPLAHGAMILFAGALLLTPGFLTDTIGFLLLVPALRAWLLRKLAKKIKVTNFSSNSQANETIEGEFKEVNPTSPPSGWTRH